ncbi:SMC family ATPase [Paenibacillus sediminis]|uniref:Nuclease SbcCD subunit C n=1 Tax=Paenibacillus sediminis TaxID=664909 RepID=A0ABS4GYN4_9BACL|nr:SMC family ATPase [Paenibacillus sediminis]MBP1935390.1 exonuclease SbcC [Paenibacillus sediminis]
MKPVSLKIAGLQSYRETQEIDFESLTETGLFGIFGPTGSGKSTILDAITLAMYGKVERASGGTQGIMNHSEDALFVSFTFELMSADGPKRYRVERRFKRTSELSVSNTVSRFIEVRQDGDVVMADKLSDVTRCVEDVIGLKMDDFTRAVVLPQGKFAEFLSLKGSERRQMLQRLFHLEKYGDQLSMKLSRKVKEVEGALKEVEAEQQGLGNASSEAVNEAKQRLAAAQEEAALRRRELDALSQRLESLAKVRELQLEREQSLLQLKQLQEQEPRIAQQEAALAKAAAAERIAPALASLREANGHAAERQAQASAARERAQQAEQAAAQAAAAELAAQQALAAEEPQLLQRQSQLEQALGLQQEVASLARELQELAAKRSEAQKQRELLMKQDEQEQGLLSKYMAAQQKLQDELNLAEVKTQERHELQQAVQYKQLITTAEDQFRLTQNERNAQYDRLVQAETRLRELDTQASQLEEQRAETVGIGLQLVKRLLQLESHTSGQYDRLLAHLDQIRKDEQAEELKKLSLRLAAELQNGQPCPVCGSVHHPHPVQIIEETTDQHQFDIESAQRLQSELQELKFKIKQYVHEVQSAIEQLGERELITSLNEVASTVVEEETTVAGHLASYDLEQAISFISEAGAVADEVRSFQQSTRSLSKQLAASQQVYSTITAEVQTERNLYDQAVRKLDLSQQQVDQLRQKWNEQYPNLLLEQVDSLYQAMLDKDSLAEQLKQRIANSITIIESKQADVRHVHQSLVDVDKQFIQWDTQWQAKSEQYRKESDRLKAWIGEEHAEPLLEAVKRQLDQIRLTAQDKHNASRLAEQTKHEALKALGIAEQALQSAEEHAAYALARWKSELESSPFADEQEVALAIMHEQQKKQYEFETKTHREQERDLNARLRDLDGKLQGQQVTAPEWEQCNTQMTIARRLDEEALQVKARAERDLEDLQQRHLRWVELEQKRLHLQHQTEQLSKLQSCLRGNAFVEYIAEEQLMQVSQAASHRLRFLTKQRYALEVDSGGGFVIRDDANGGVKRPVSTLSGGETFLTSLSLALALSAQIQLSGQYPLQFFFLDEGFGTLDPELLDTVITSLEKLHNDHLSVGVISHVPELRARLPRKLVVLPAEQAGGGSRVVLEKL